VGAQFRVEYAERIGGPDNWQPLITVTLSSSSHLVIDPQSPGKAQRYYRAVLMP